MRSGRKNARGGGRTKESTNKGATKWCAPPLTKKAPYKPCARIGLARICAGGAGELASLPRTYELTSSIVPQGTSFHRSVELGFSPIGFDPERFSCGCRHLLPGPPELGAVTPDAVHDHGQPARERHDRFLHPAAPGDLHGPRLEPGPFF